MKDAGWRFRGSAGTFPRLGEVPLYSDRRLRALNKQARWVQGCLTDKKTHPLQILQ